MSENATQNSLSHPQEPPKKHTGRTIGILIGVIALIAAIAAALALHLISEDPVKKEDPEEEAYAAVIGQHNLTAAEANYFYIDCINKTYDAWCGTYGVHAGLYIQILYRLNISAPLDSQYYDEAQQITWAAHFADQAMQDAAACYALYDAAKAEDFKLSEQDQAALDAQTDQVQLYSEALGYTFPVEYIRAIYGKSADMASYKDYLELRAIADAYRRNVENSLTYDDAALRAYEKDKYHQFSSFSYCQHYIKVSDYLTGGIPDSDGNLTYSPEQIQAADDKAKQTAAVIARSGAGTKEELDKVIAQLDPQHGPSEIKENILYNNAPASLGDWLCYEGRKAGDITTIAETSLDSLGNAVTDGYYVVMLLQRNENLMDLVNIRHILVAYEGGFGMPDGSTIYPGASKNISLSRAEQILGLYYDGDQTEDAFAALAAEYSDDTGSASRGGLYTDICPGQMIRPIHDWCFDESRSLGDVEMIESENGLHLVYYSGTGTMTYRDYLITEILRQADTSAWYETMRAATAVSDLDLAQLKTDHIIQP